MHFTFICMNQSFVLSPLPLSLPLLLPSPPHLLCCSKSSSPSPLLHTNTLLSPSATSARPDQLPQQFFISTNSINNANEPPLNYFPSLLHKEQFGARTRSGEGQRAPSRRQGMAVLLLPSLPPTLPPASQQRLTSLNVITVLTCPICSVAGREGFNYISSRHAGEH